jgi:hypothetical protein
MTDLRSALERYLSMRQGLGYKYQHQARRLTDFVSFMETHKAATITTKLAVAWATLPPDRHALRLTDVRGFARHVVNIDPQTEAPPAGILPRLKRAKLYVYSDAEVDGLLAAALALSPSRPIALMDLPLPVRVDRGDGHASLRGDRTSARRRRPG